MTNNISINEEYWTATDAANYMRSLGINVTLPTVSNWISKNKLGVQFMKRGAWYIKPNVFKQYIKKCLGNDPFKGNFKGNETKIVAKILTKLETIEHSSLFDC